MTSTTETRRTRGPSQIVSRKGAEDAEKTIFLLRALRASE